MIFSKLFVTITTLLLFLVGAALGQDTDVAAAARAAKAPKSSTAAQSPATPMVPASKMSDEFVKATMTAVNAIPLSSSGKPLAVDHADQAILNVLTLADLELDESTRQMETDVYRELLSFQILYASAKTDKAVACYKAIKVQIRQRSVRVPEACE